MTRRRVASALLLWMGCGNSEDNTSVADAGVSSVADAGEAGASDATLAADAALCAPGDFQACACPSGGVGKRSCEQGIYASCSQCTAAVATGESKCEAGTYVGTWTLDYASGPDGLDGLIRPLAPTHSEGEWVFNLQKTGSAEFFSVGDGCLRIVAKDAAASQVINGRPLKPFRAFLTGKVNCETGVLDGELKGTYDAANVITLGQEVRTYYVKGAIRGVFDPATRSFKAGTWDPREPAVLIGEPPGGQGTWTATLDNDASAPATQADCLGGVTFKDELFP